MPYRFMHLRIVMRVKPFELIARLTVQHGLAERAGLGSAQLASALGLRDKQSQIYRYLNGQVREPQRATAEAMARLFDIPIDAVYNERIATDVAIERGFVEGVTQQPALAQPLSHRLINTAPPQELKLIEWGKMRYDELPEEFLVTAPDDAMADRVLKGYVVRCRKLRQGERPLPGDGVVVEDSAGDWYLRAYSAGPNGRFSAIAANALYQPMFDDRDGLKVLAIVMGVPEGRWGQ